MAIQRTITRALRLVAITGCFYILLSGWEWLSPDASHHDRQTDYTQYHKISDDYDEFEITPPASKLNSSLCQYNDCLKGRWVPRDPQFTALPEVHKVFGQFRCDVKPPPPGETRTDEETKALEEKKMLDIMNWAWQPEKGVWKEWDTIDMVVRLLKSPGGLIFMGDSLSQGHDHAFGSLLQQSEIYFDTNPPHLPLDRGIRTHVLQRNHPMTLRLQKLAGVPDSRLDYPVFTIIEEHMLVHEEDLRLLTRIYGAKDGWVWYLDTMKRADDWEAFFAWITQGRPGEEETVTGDTLLLLNTGAHWSRGPFYMMPTLGPGSAVQERAALTGMYRIMTKMVVQRLSPFSRLTVLYRATSPAHPSCHRYTNPLNASEAYEMQANFLELMDADAKDANDRIVRRRWDWDLFNVHNMVWKKEIASLARHRKKVRAAEKQRGEAAGHAGSKWLFMDVYDMALQRPDAHSSPTDCLHWCIPGMYSEWSRHLYHLLFLEMEQS